MAKRVKRMTRRSRPGATTPRWDPRNNPRVPGRPNPGYRRPGDPEPAEDRGR
jgi:hypothetical protein